MTVEVRGCSLLVGWAPTGSGRANPAGLEFEQVGVCPSIAPQSGQIRLVQQAPGSPPSDAGASAPAVAGAALKG